MMLGGSRRKKQGLSETLSRAARSASHLVLDASRPHRPFWVLAFVMLTAAITPYPSLELPFAWQDIETAVVADQDIRAQIPFASEDLEATQKARKAAAAEVADTYRVDVQVVDNHLAQLDARVAAVNGHLPKAIDAMRRGLLQSDMRRPEAEVIREALYNYCDDRSTADFELSEDESTAAMAPWFYPTPDSVAKREPVDADENASADRPRRVKALVEPPGAPFVAAYADALGEAARESLEYVLSYGVMDPALMTDRLGLDSAASITVVREKTVGGQKVSEELPLSQVLDPLEGISLLQSRLGALVAAIPVPQGGLAVDTAALQQAALVVARPEVTPTLVFDQVSTEAARERARAAVEAVMKEFSAGEMIIRGGDRWTPQARADAMAYLRELESGERTLSRLLGALLGNCIFAALATLALLRSRPLLGLEEEDLSRSLNVGALLMCLAVVLGRIVFYFDPTGYAVPVAAAGILVAILVNARLAVMVSVLTSALIMVQFDYNWRVFVVQLAMSLTGVFSIYSVRRRSDMTGAALKATAVGVAAMAAIALSTDSLLSEDALRWTVLVLLNGGLCMVLVPGVLSPLERLFRITTDIQLLEYSDLNNEVLSRMAIEVPATYAHSLMMGQMAEAAAVAVGANGLMARVCAYYHDVGKMRRPEYFSENQTGINVHDELTPRMSARAIAAHVTDGVETAREFHLPKPILDGIREHHGTCLISFFYQQAMEQQKHGDVREEDFRYPGPKPQRPETAILMICDAVESGVRSIKNPNEDRIREFVDKIITARSADGQFDECDLTLKDLGVIREVLTRQVMTSLHTRIAYPDRAVRKEPEPEPEAQAATREGTR